MSLPKRMKWDGRNETEGQRMSYQLESKHWLALEDYEFSGVFKIPYDGTLAHAELIIRAIEAPETLEVKDELT